MPAVTVLMPVHNSARFLGEAMGGVLAQDLEDFELHVLDDESNDETPRIAQSTGDPRVRYSRNGARFGLFRTLNRGFREANTDLVRLWAHDDRMLPGSLRAFVAFAEAHPQAGMVYSDYYAIDATGRRTGADVLPNGQRARTPELSSGRLAALLFWCYGCLPGNISTVLLRKTAWESVGGFVEDIQQAPDYDMWTRIAVRWQIGFLRDKLVEVREHEMQLSRVGQKMMTTLEEELPVKRRLETALRGVMSDAELRRTWRDGRGRQHVHWIARALLRGDLAAARRGWRALVAYGDAGRQVVAWLLSANGHLFATDADEWFDRKAALCRASE